MNNKLKMLTFAAIAAFIGVIAWAVLSVPPEINKEQVQVEKERAQFIEHGPNTIKEELNGKLVWELSSESSRTNVKTHDTELNKLTGKYYQANGNVLTVTANKGIYNEVKKTMKLMGEVKAVNTDTSVLTCKELEWVEKDGCMIAVGDAKLVRPDIEATGNRLEAWDGFERFKAVGKAHIIRKNSAGGIKK